MTGRAQAFTAAILFFSVSFVIMATAHTYETLVGGQVVYAFGFAGTSVLAPIVIADMTDVSNRGFFQALYNLPEIINIFAAGAAAQELLEQQQWRWAYGMIPIMVIGTSAPLLVGLWYGQIKEKRKQKENAPDELPEKGQLEGKNILQKLYWLAIEIDLIGSILLVAALCLILLPLILARTSWGGWGSSLTIGTLVAGAASLVLFVIWEWKFSIKSIIPITHWKSTTPLLGVLSLSIKKALVSMIMFQYFLTYLQVTRGVTPKAATYLERGYNVTFIGFQIIVGYVMKRTRRWRPIVIAGCCIIILGMGLMIPARRPTASNAFLAVSQVITGIGAGMMHIPLMVGVQSTVPRKDLAIATALQQLGQSIATSIGSAIAGSIWNSLIPAAFARHIPGQYDYQKIVKSIPYTRSLPKAQLDGVIAAYAEVMNTVSIVMVCVAILPLIVSIPIKSFGFKEEEEEDQLTATSSREDVSNEKKTTEETPSQEDVQISTKVA
ncbi:hypothetical protein EC973_003800 [Apophysomyces ossiformis]|uniref:Major facilitator superfamily (MFS) profile domain-containing protein n=1 Tax=Apophysomyces ossiformis TaxID=679940 RepID=A0A8H7BQD5_9FUNG|nr:hypothetical protein EC973_003800 [Apophysomyces ossiformis]